MSIVMDCLARVQQLLKIASEEAAMQLTVMTPT
jgi:hypothetical protein